MNKKIISFLILICTFAFPACTSNTNTSTAPVSRTGFYFDTVVTISIYNKSEDECNTLLDTCFELCDTYEKLLSRTVPESDIAKLNSGDTSFTLSDPALELINTGLYYCSLSDGALDITLAPVISLWDFTSGSNIIPAASKISEALDMTGYKKLSEYTSTTNAADMRDAIIASGVKLDVGAIAKGFIADKLKDCLEDENVESAIIDLGGNILCIGDKPDGSPFKIGIKRPFSETGELMMTLDISDRSVVSSGIYERFFIEEDIIYHHILNSQTGYPVNNGILSVTIVSDNSVDGDALSTACFALGIEKGIELVNSLDNVTIYFVDSDYNIISNEAQP